MAIMSLMEHTKDNRQYQAHVIEIQTPTGRSRRVRSAQAVGHSGRRPAGLARFSEVSEMNTETSSVSRAGRHDGQIAALFVHRLPREDQSESQS